MPKLTLSEPHVSICICDECQLGLTEKHGLGCGCEGCRARRERLMRNPHKDSILGILIAERRDATRRKAEQN